MFIKNCPKCGSEQKYSLKGNLDKAVAVSQLCRKCACENRSQNVEWKQKQSEARKRLWETESYRKNVSTRIAQSMTDDVRKKISESQIRTWQNESYREMQVQMGKKRFENDEYRSKTIETNRRLATDDNWKQNHLRGLRNGKHHSKEYRLWRSNRSKELYNDPSYRLAVAKRNVKQYNNKFIAYNPKACKLADWLNNRYGLHLRHALNNEDGEFHPDVPYFPDCYDDEAKVWIEYDEPAHERTSRKVNDFYRQQRIMQILPDYRFIRYSEKFKTLYECFADGTVKKYGNSLDLNTIVSQ